MKQFLYYLNANDAIYYLFIAEGLTFDFAIHPHVHLIPIKKKSAFQRILWDCYGLKRWLKRAGIQPHSAISLQNTSMALPKGCKQYIYLHQALPLHPKKWSFFKKYERELAFYKYIYPLFIFLFVNKNTEFIVQTTWMRDALCKKFHWDANRVQIVKPRLIPIAHEKVNDITLAFGINLFYPANSALFKNHIELVWALGQIQKESPELSVGLYLTIHPEENKNLQILVQQLGLEEKVIFLGPLAQEEVFSYYKACTAVVFPSYIESFGLPLLEAMEFGKIIVACDRDWVKEIIKNYALALLYSNKCLPQIEMLCKYRR